MILALMLRRERLPDKRKKQPFYLFMRNAQKNASPEEGIQSSLADSYFTIKR